MLAENGNMIKEEIEKIQKQIEVLENKIRQMQINEEYERMIKEQSKRFKW